MNNLTNDITRLCGEIAALRDGRAALMSSLAETRPQIQGAVSRMLTGFREARADMAKQTKTQLRGFVLQVKDAVTDLRQKVAQLQDEFRGDLAGAHQAWSGAVSAPRPATTGEEPPTRAAQAAYEEAPKGRKKKR